MVSYNNHKTLNKHILIVDDEPNIMVPVAFLMEQQGFKVSQANNGKVALNTVANDRPDIIILDVMMPEMDGFEVARRIRENPDCRDVSIIFLTARGTQRDKMNGYALGGEVYLTKPFDNDDLVNIVTEMAAYG